MDHGEEALYPEAFQNPNLIFRGESPQALSVSILFSSEKNHMSPGQNPVTLFQECHYPLYCNRLLAVSLSSSRRLPRLL